MLTDQDIGNLIAEPKRITAKDPARGYREEKGHRRCDLELESLTNGEDRFEVFIRQNSQFIENFSLGLKYLNRGAIPRSFTLVRFNGPHGEISIQPDGHYAVPHIHRISAIEVEAGSIQPKERHRELTDRYLTFESALVAFFEDIRVSNYIEYFSETVQGRMFNGY